MTLIPEKAPLSWQGVAKIVNKVSVNSNRLQSLTVSCRDRYFSISATACNSKHKELQGVTNNFKSWFPYDHRAASK